MARPENTSFDNFDPRDFGEPTPETRARFDSAFNRLRELAVSHRTYDVDEIIGDVDVESRFGISRDDLCPVDIVYGAGFDDEMLYITNPRDPSISLFSDELLAINA